MTNRHLFYTLHYMRKFITMALLLTGMILMLPVQSQALVRQPAFDSLHEYAQPEPVNLAEETFSPIFPEIPEYVVLIVEVDGLLYGIICQNDPVNRYDPTGLASKWNPLGWPGKLVQGVGWVLKKSRIPLVKNVGPTIESAGTLVESPATFIEGVIILEVPTLKESGEEFASGTLGIIGLKTLLELDRWEYPPTGSIKVPPHINLAIREAHNTFWQAPAWEQWWDYNITGRKYWHTLSYSYMASEAGITEIPWLWLGGVVHELWPPDFHAEMGDHPIPFTSPGQGALHGPYRWGAIYSAPMTVVDLSGDIIANTSGLAAGLLFPKSWLDPYARITGKIIIGPPDEWRFQLQQFQQQP